jgi:hypothetical protein
MPVSTLKRPLILGLLATSAAVALSGCSFFRGKEAPYLESRESRPLEVPPDLVLPSSSAAPAIFSAVDVLPTPPLRASMATVRFIFMDALFGQLHCAIADCTPCNWYRQPMISA